MFIKIKLFFTFSIFIAVCAIYWFTRPVVIVGIHQNGDWSEILVKNFPITKAGKIKWWGKNSVMLKEKYNIPQPNGEGYYYVTVWDFGDGYKKMPETDQGSDLRCFEDMQTEENCIEKNNLFEVSKSRNLGLLYY